MKFAHINATEEQRWRWFTYKDKNQACEVELKLITTEDVKEFLGEDQDLLARQALVAKQWFRGFRGVLDANGVEVPVTEQMRLEILKDLDVWNFIQKKFAASANWRAEGKGDSGSAS